jgi:hypothetical protein
MKTATYIKNLEGWRGDARLYRLSEPVEYGYSYDDEELPTTEFVIVSAICAPFFGAETYIFPADEEGNAIEMGEMDGSYRGGASHAIALEGAGFSIV